MKILVLSDIGWWRRPPKYDCSDDSPLYRILSSYLKEIIMELKPSFIFLGGDLIDRVPEPPEEVFQELIELLYFINDKKIYCFLVEGNHDYKFYPRIVKKIEKLEYVIDISDKTIQINKFKFLGISYQTSKKLPKLQELIMNNPQKIDFVLAHAELSRRVMLFKLNTRFIITGHFRSYFYQLRDKIILATDVFPYYYAIVDYDGIEDKIVLYYEDEISIEGILKDKNLITKKDKRNKYQKEYAEDSKRKMSLLMQAEERQDSVSDEEMGQIIYNLMKDGISEYLIYDYLKCRINICIQCGKVYPNLKSYKEHISSHKKL